ncbi:MAG: CheY-like chemotaxis protein/TolB-like protein [Candidatus Azotimanducaceae bacterium]|jgi:CheY-like chemotaxis protein/TolB-like protein
MPHIPAYLGNDPYLFVSYAHLDDGLVMPEIEWLNHNGFNVWYDHGITGGSEWREEIAQKIKHASQILFFVSENSVHSPVCMKEVSYALAGGGKVLPIYLTPAVLPEGLKLSLSDIQALFKFSSPDQFYRVNLKQALAETMKARLETTIAVLPFSSSALDKKLDDFFSHGIAEEIINGLVQSKQVKVIARRASFNIGLETADYSAIGQALKVTHVVEGSVRMTDNQVRVNTQLVNVVDASTVWSNSLDREVTDILQVQDEIIREILLVLNLGPETGATQPQQVNEDINNLEPEGDQHQTTNHMDNSAYSILVVDDEELNHDMLSRRLKRKGYHVLLASDGYTALGIVEMEKVDLILLDIMMPGVDGLQVLQGLREKRTELQLPIIMVSALTDSDVMVKALSAGANDYVTKPLDFPVVLARIEAQLRNKVSSPQQKERSPPIANRWDVPQVTSSNTASSVEEDLAPSRENPDTPINSKAEVEVRILLVEDNELNRDMLTRRLVRRGYQVTTANDGAQALVQARAEQPDLILMDLRMPVMNGWEATRALKLDPFTAQIPVIALSAHTMDTDKQKALDAGCDSFETKPVVLPRLLDEIVRLLALSQHRSKK